MDLNLQKQREQCDQRIETLRARRQDLKGALARFHLKALAAPEVWRDPQVGGKALACSFEYRDTDYELHLLYGQRTALERQERISRAAGGGAPRGGAPLTSVPFPDAQEVRAFEAREAFYDAIDHLRQACDAETGAYVRRVDREEVARLRWLLDILAEVQPDASRAIEDDWRRLWSERRAVNEHRSKPSPGLSRSGRLERWQRETADKLAIFLEPLLPTAPC